MREANLRRASRVASSVCPTYLRECEARMCAFEAHLNPKTQPETPSEYRGCEARMCAFEARLNPKLNLNRPVNAGVEALREFGF